MNDDRRNNSDFEENDKYSSNEDIEQGTTSINDFSDNRNIYDPKGTIDEEPSLGNGQSANINFNDNSNEIKKLVREEVKKAKPKNLLVKFIAVALVFSLLGSGVTGLIMSKVFGGNSTGSTGGNTTSKIINVKDDGNIENAVAAKAIPSVVGVTTSTATTIPYIDQQTYTEGVGSGVIITKDGYILTNSHVVNDGKADAIKVVFSDGEEIEAKLIWQDSSLDLAVVKVEKTGLTPVDLADSDKVTVGDRAIAIGNPLGLDLQSTLTSGVISGLNRTITLEGGSSMSNLMQTDASINSGNSGGALLNSKGELIGINTAKASQGEGIGFAIPINTAKSILDKIIETGTFESVTLGIQGIDLETYETYFKVDTGADNGVAIMMVEDNSPAAKAGLKQSDVITNIDGKEIVSMNNLRTALVGYSFGDKAKLKLIRNSEEMEIEVTFEKYEAPQNSNNQEQQNQNNNQEQSQGGIINPFR